MSYSNLMQHRLIYVYILNKLLVHGFWFICWRTIFDIDLIFGNRLCWAISPMHRIYLSLSDQVILLGVIRSQYEMTGSGAYKSSILPYLSNPWFIASQGCSRDLCLALVSVCSFTFGSLYLVFKMEPRMTTCRFWMLVLCL